MNPNLFTIIVTYNAMPWAERCFTSLRKSSVSVNVIVVDNGSTDGTQDYIKANFPEADLIQSEENLGFGRANNLAIEKAYKNGADFFYLMNQDAWVFDDSFEKLIEAYELYENKEEIGIISPIHLEGSEQLLDLHFERYLARSTEYNRLTSDLVLGNIKPYYELKFVNAAHWLLPRRAVETVGGFNPYFFHGAEDYDYVNRAYFYKKRILLATQSKVVHDAKKIAPTQDKKEQLKNTRISMRMQRETKYMDPAYNFDVKNEKKEFVSNILKLKLKRNFDESRFYKEMYDYFKPKFSEITKLRAEAVSGKHAFLNL